MSEKRMISDYEVIASQKIGEDEVILAEKHGTVLNEKYLCCFAYQNGIAEFYKDALVGDNYAEMMKVYGERIASSADKVLTEQEKEENTVGKELEITRENCEPFTYEDNLENKVIVIDANVLKPEYRRATHQLMLCTGGFGSHPNARGRTCYCISLYDGHRTQFWRQDVIGTMSEEKLPTWAKDGLSKAIEIREADNIPPQKRGEPR